MAQLIVAAAQLFSLQVPRAAGLRAQADLCNVALRICLNLTLAISARHLSDADAFVESVRERYDALRVTVTPQDKVELQGKIDKDWNEFEIDVKQVIKLNK